MVFFVEVTFFIQKPITFFFFFPVGVSQGKRVGTNDDYSISHTKHPGLLRGRGSAVAVPASPSVTGRLEGLRLQTNASK